jgi:nucleotide-binding universal stress UspA family protein
MAKFKRILVAVDGSATSMKAMREAVELACESGSVLRVLYAFGPGEHMPGPGPGHILDDALAMAEADGVEASSRLVEFPGQSLGEVVADEARHWNADLIVVGTHGRKGITRAVLGSGAEQIIRLAPAAVLVVRGH